VFLINNEQHGAHQWLIKERLNGHVPRTLPQEKSTKKVKVFFRKTIVFGEIFIREKTIPIYKTFQKISKHFRAKLFCVQDPIGTKDIQLVVLLPRLVLIRYGAHK